MKPNVQIKPFSTYNDYFVIDYKGCYTCLVPVEHSNLYKERFEKCTSAEDILSIIHNNNLIY